MKNKANNSSFFKASSLCLILSYLVINVFKCEASAVQDAIEQEKQKDARSSLAVLSLPENGTIPQPPVLHAIDVPWEKIRESGQTFWAELVSLAEKDHDRDGKIDLGNNAFSEVTDLVSLFEDHDYGVLDLKTALSQRECKLKFTLGNDEFVIHDVREILLKALNQWRPLQECFFSLNQSVSLLRRRILADYKLMQAAYEREIQLTGSHRVLEKTNESWSTQYTQLRRQTKEVEDSNQALIHKKEKLESENALLKAQVSKSEEENRALAEENRRLRAEEDRSKAAPEVAITIPQDNQVILHRKPGFWAWVWSWFGRSGERQKLLNHGN